MSDRLPLPSRFKGGRDYLHGTDIHDAVCKALDAAGHDDIRKIDLTFHKIVREGLDAELVERSGAGAPPADAAVVFQFQAGERAFAVYLRPTGEAVTTRDPYPEEQIVDACRFELERKEVTAPEALPFSNIEILVAMNKALLERLFPDVGGKWYFTRLQLTESIWQRKFSTLLVRLEANMNFLVTKSSITADGRPLGHIYFSLVK